MPNGIPTNLDKFIIWTITKNTFKNRQMFKFLPK